MSSSTNWVGKIFIFCCLGIKAVKKYNISQYTWARNLTCYAGVIASTGWDSLTMSAIEMSASGLPLLVSNLQGLKETVEDGESGYIFSAGHHFDLINKLTMLINDKSLHEKMSTDSRNRAIETFSENLQLQRLIQLLENPYINKN